MIFTGIAVSVLAVSATQRGKIIQGTIATALIPEMIAVVMAKKALNEMENKIKAKTI